VGQRDDKSAPIPRKAGASLTKLIVVRHGETVWNAEGRIQGQLDVALNENGQLQARQLASAFEKLGIAANVDAIVSSDLARARQTADEIARVCTHAQRSTDMGLREINFGDLQGTLASEKPALKEAVYGAWKRGEFFTAFPQGECASDVVSRGLSSLRATATLGSTVVVVAHGGLIKWCAISIALGEKAPCAEAMMSPDIAELLSARVQNCCCSTVMFDHVNNRFVSEGWFQNVSANEEALDDSG